MQSHSTSQSKIPISPNFSINSNSKAASKKKLSEEKPFGRLWPFPNESIPPGSPPPLKDKKRVGKAGFEAAMDVGDAPW